MGGRITSLKFQKRTPDRVNVYLDDEFAFGLASIEAAQLHLGQYLGDDDIARLQEQDSVQKAYDRATRFLSYRPRSRAEVERNLSESGTDEPIIQAVIERLTRQGYLNDVEFARYWIENREQFRPRGERALRQELRLKGVDEEATAAILSELDPEASAYKAGRPRAHRMAELARQDASVFRQKLGTFLLRRGFGYEVVRRVVLELEQEVTGDQGQSMVDESA